MIVTPQEMWIQDDPKNSWTLVQEKKIGLSHYGNLTTQFSVRSYLVFPLCFINWNIFLIQKWQNLRIDFAIFMGC